MKEKTQESEDDYYRNWTRVPEALDLSSALEAGDSNVGQVCWYAEVMSNLEKMVPPAKFENKSSIRGSG